MRAVTLACFCCLFLAPSVLTAADLPVKTTAVAGFVNTGDSAYDYLSDTISLSLSSYLARVPQSKILTSEAVAPTARDQGYFSKGVFHEETAVKVGQILNATQVLGGTYRVNPQENRITVEIYGLDTVTGTLLFKRTYRGQNGPGLMDVLETMQKAVAGLLISKEVKMASLGVSVTNSLSQYQLYINGRNTALVSQTQPWKSEFALNEQLEITLRQPVTGLEVLRRQERLTGPQTIVYNPSAPVFIESTLDDVSLILNSTNRAQIRTGQIFRVDGLIQDQEYQLILKKGNWMTPIRKVKVKEGVPVVLKYQDSDFQHMLDYSHSLPGLNFLVPGIAQYQADDILPGILFTAVWAGALAFTGYCTYGYVVTYQKRTDETKTQAYRDAIGVYNDQWAVSAACGGAAVIGTTLWSFFHAVFQPTFQNNPLLNTVQVTTSPDGLAVISSLQF